MLYKRNILYIFSFFFFFGELSQKVCNRTDFIDYFIPRDEI